MKSCRRCTNFKNDYCKLHNITITDILDATYCPKYNTKVNDKIGVKCINCQNMNKFHYCFVKRVCIDFENRTRERKCIHYKDRNQKKHFKNNKK